MAPGLEGQQKEVQAVQTVVEVEVVVPGLEDHQEQVQAAQKVVEVEVCADVVVMMPMSSRLWNFRLCHFRHVLCSSNIAEVG